MKLRRPVPIRIEWHDFWALLAATCVMLSAVVVAKLLQSYWPVMVSFMMFCIMLGYVYWMYWRDK